jgi:hypothetical protein
MWVGLMGQTAARARMRAFLRLSVVMMADDVSVTPLIRTVGMAQLTALSST